MKKKNVSVMYVIYNTPLALYITYYGNTNEYEHCGPIMMVEKIVKRVGLIFFLILFFVLVMYGAVGGVKMREER